MTFAHVRAALPEHPAGDDHLLDLAGALVDPEQAHVAVHALDGHAAHVARAAVDLHRPVGDAPDGLGAEVLRRRRPEGGVRAVVVGLRRLADQRPPGVPVGHRVGHEALHELVGRDRVPALLAHRRELRRLVHQPRGHPHAQRGDVQPPVGEAAHGGDEAAVQALVPADEVRRPAPGRRRGRPRTSTSRAGPSSRRARRTRRRRRRVGTRKVEMPLAGEASGSVRAKTMSTSASGALVIQRFWPVITQLVAVTHRLRGQRRRVGAGVGLGEREGRDDLAGGQARQPLLLLLGGAAGEQHLPGDAVVGAEQRAQRRRGPAELHRELDLLAHREPDAPELLGDREAVEPHRLALLAQLGGHLVGGLDLVLARHHLLAHELAHRGQDVGEVIGLHGAHGVTFRAAAPSSLRQPARHPRRSR